ncbi:glycosyltransferase family 2 protein [Ottowia sp.]|uniref:glycosyltransferase family 2 protein n=1 Tax=Ottowia sp. TaxID=1898956 RepID=UPI002C350840|nr:glycosyltransferase family 2 protein [Ottowia sp.]MCP5259548.1 glycosyltransferase family 2 protein [Burkholderiaceae bacterium]HRW72518.1 glycosyltransferase family 2 protein [Ottowia sp.]
MPQLSVVVPTFNESANVAELHRRVAEALAGSDWEMIFVDDDSPDATADTVRALAQQDPRVRCLQRIGRRGLASACVEGMLASSAPIVAVIDADLQHDERLLPKMLALLQAEPAVDVVVGSRYIEGGGTGDWAASREHMSRWATKLSQAVIKADVQDPMSGFFMIRQPAVLASVRAGMSAVGFKILLDLLAASPRPLVVRELPYEFRNRFAGESKLDTSVMWEYAIMLLDHWFGRLIPVRFIAFTLVGGLGLLVHMAVLALLFKGGFASFVTAQAVATFVAMTGNFVLNNWLTYRDRRLKGWGWLRGWISFTLVCSVGALANVGLAGWLFREHSVWWGASAVAGVLIGAVWNYAVTAVYTWNRKG